MTGWQPISTAPKDGTARVPLTRGLAAIIDADDLMHVCGRKWQAHARRDGKGYYAVDSSGTRMHRLLMGPGDGQIVDHIDGDGLNNTRKNLRIGTQSQNCVNRKTTPGRYMRGVRKWKRRWKASIKVGNKQKHLGIFASELEAHEAYLKASKELHGDWQPLPEPPA